jgi:hypothetical protein
MTKKKHALRAVGGPAICGMGQGQTLFVHVAGTPIDDLATLDIDQHVTCKRCRSRVRKRFPFWFDVLGGFIRR